MAALTVSTTPQLVPSGGSRDIRSIQSNTQTIWVDGTSSVSAATGYPVYPGEPFYSNILDIYPDLWVVTASGTADLRYII